MCKHQIVVIFACTNIIQEDIIHYYGTWYGSHHGKLGHMFVNPQHIPNDMKSNDDAEDERFEGDDDSRIMEFDRLTTMKQSDLRIGGIVRSHETIHS
jgi:hypothetical protein